MNRVHQNGRAWAGWSLGAIVCATVGACSLHQEGVHPPDNRIFFPGGAIIDKGGKWLYVVNSNSDLRYNSGTVVAVDLNLVRDDDPRPNSKTRWKTCNPDTRYVPPANLAETDQCCWDVLDETILNCDDQKYINGQKDRTVRIGSFGGRPVIQDLPATSKRRMFIPVRGDTSVTMIDISGADQQNASFLCTGARTTPNNPQPFLTACDDNWRITHLTTDDQDARWVNVPENQLPTLPDEPYALAADDDLQLMYVGHLRGGNVSLIDLGDGSTLTTPNLLQTVPGLVPANAAGFQGVTSLTIKTAGCFGSIYAASRGLPVVTSFVVYGLDQSCGLSGTATGNRTIAIVGTGQTLSTGIGGSETRGIEFVRKERTSSARCNVDKPPSDCYPAPDRAFILQRVPPALVALDAATLSPFSVIEVCQSPTSLVQQVDATGKALSLLVTCFDASEVYVIDPWIPRIRAIVPVGRGPITTILPPVAADGAMGSRDRAFVVGFGGNNVAVVDLDPNSPTQYRVVQRIGFPSATPRGIGPQ